MVAFDITPDLTLRELGEWARRQSSRLLDGLDTTHGDELAFVLAQAVKLAEEVGELQAEVLGHAGYQRASKGRAYSTASIGDELADVLVCAAILASSHSVDLGKAVATKLEQIERRHQSLPTAGTE